MIDLRSSSVEETHTIAAAIAGLVRPRDMVLLVGEMGAGKTAFATGFAKALGVHGMTTCHRQLLLWFIPIPLVGFHCTMQTCIG